MKLHIHYLLIMALFCNSQSLKSMQLTLAMALAHTPKNAIVRKAPLAAIPRRPYISEVAHNCKLSKTPHHRELLLLRSKLLEEQPKLVPLNREIATNQALLDTANKQKELLLSIKKDLNEVNNHIALYEKPYYELTQDFERVKESLRTARYNKYANIALSPCPLLITLTGGLLVNDIYKEATKTQMIHIAKLYSLYPLSIFGLGVSITGILWLRSLINEFQTSRKFINQQALSYALLKQVLENRTSEEPEENEIKG